MIIKDQETTIEQIGNVTDQSEFKMRTSQKAFQILSSLYSDKPLAIVRELGCNAMDSHIASGQPNRPFHIHIPNALEPWLTIQDFGTGISHENIYEIYSVYFASTKTNTNTQVGMLGLGSKSPFCYTDNFTITSIHNQVKRVYNAYFNQNGMPTISLASQEQTTEENGVAVKIPIKHSDFNNFSQAIYKSFRFFDTKPDITGGKIDWNTDKPDFSGSFWKSYTRMSGSAFAIMGGVAYPIDIYKMSDDHYEILRKAGLVIQFNIGELDVTPSREALMYHDWVIKAINDKIDKVKKDFVQVVENTIKSSPNLIDSLQAIYHLKDQWSFLNSSMLNGKVYWNQVEISEPRQSIKKLAPSIKSYSKRQWGRAKWSESEYAALHNNAIWYYDNLKQGSIKRITHHIRHNPNSDISINFVTEYDMKNLVKAGFPSSVFNPTSNLPAVASNRGSGGTKTSRPKGIINLYNFGYQYRQSWESEQFDLANGTAPKYYIVKSKDNWHCVLPALLTKSGEKVVIPSTKEKLQDVLNFLQIKMDNVKMVSENNAKFLDALGSINLATIIAKKKVDIDIDQMIQAKLIENRIVNELVKNKRFQSLDNQNDFKKFILEQDSVLKDVKNFYGISKYIDWDRSEKNSLTFPSKMVELFYLACSSWQVGIERVMDTILEIEQNN
jgi:hypothetical protein